MTTNIPACIASIRGGEDTTLKLEELSFRGFRMVLGRDMSRPAARLAESSLIRLGERGWE